MATRAFASGKPVGFGPLLLAVLRFMTGLLFLQHGLSKMVGWPVNVAFPHQPAPFTLIWFAGVFEIVGSPLIMLGLFTRSVAFLLSGTMAVGYFVQLAPRGFFPMNNTGDATILFCFVFLYLSAAGPGAFSLDGWIKARRNAR